MVLSAKSASFLGVVLQQSLLVLVIRYTKTRHQVPYLTSVAVWSAECLKMLLSTTLEHLNDKIANKNGSSNDIYTRSEELLTSTSTSTSTKRSSSSWLAVLKDMSSMSPISESIKLTIPAFLYVVQNYLLFFALSNLSVPTYQVTAQGKILTTAVFSRILLKKQISTMQYLSLLLLAGGVALVNLSEYRTITITNTTTAAINTHEQNQILGLLAVGVTCVTSAICGVYFELLIKTTTQISVHKRNFQLAFWSFLLTTGTIFYNDMDAVMDKGLFQGFDGAVIVVIVCQALGGLLVSLMLKYADAILKGFATSVAILVATAMSVILFDAKLSFLFFLGGGMVGSALKIYSSYPYQSKEGVGLGFGFGSPGKMGSNTRTGSSHCTFRKVKFGLILMALAFLCCSWYFNMVAIDMNATKMGIDLNDYWIPTTNAINTQHDGHGHGHEAPAPVLVGGPRK